MREWLKNIRTEKGLSQQSVAESLGIAQQYYSLIENGERQSDLNLSLVTKLSEILGVSVNKIIAEENNVQRK